MCHKFYFNLMPFLLLALCPMIGAAQSCNSNDSPITYNAVDLGGGNCLIQINWNNEMPELTCGNPGTPAPGSTIPNNRELKDLQVTVDGNVYILFQRNGNNCTIGDLKYGLTPNTYETTISNPDFCDAASVSSIAIEGNQSGGNSFSCDLVNADVAAPIELSYFKGAVSERTNVLQWATSSEENVSTFVIEKSTDGRRNVKTVGSKIAAGFSDQMQYYQIEDKNPQPLTYYRLRSIDFDGTYSESDWVAVQRRTNDKFNMLQISPVPLGNEPLEVYYQANTKESVLISITDISGRKLWEERKELEEGVYNWSIEIPTFQQHLLVLRISSRDGVISRLIPVETN